MFRYPRGIRNYWLSTLRLVAASFSLGLIPPDVACTPFGDVTDAPLVGPMPLASFHQTVVIRDSLERVDSFLVGPVALPRDRGWLRIAAVNRGDIPLRESGDT